MKPMQNVSLVSMAAVALLLGACAQKPIVSEEEGGVVPAPQPQARVVPPTLPAEPPVVEAPPVPKINPMADIPGDRPVPPLAGAIERIDCMNGVEDLHARMALEARGGQIASFAYYSKWKPRTCAFDFARTSPGTKWRLTPDGATRVHTPDGRFLIRTTKEAYVFEFEQVQRGRYCGMPGTINGTMTVKRVVRKPECSVSGIMDTNDSYLDTLYKGRLK